VFKDIRYKVKIGQRYRFAINIDNQSEEEKNIWIGVNRDSMNPTSQ
jgi:hypothetical protein